MKRSLLIIFLIGFIAFSGILFAGNEVQAAGRVLRVGATAIPHAEILKIVKPLLAEKGIELKIVDFTDYVTPNLALADGSIDANYFQHLPYLNTFKTDHKLKLTSVAKIHVEPFGLYSKKINKLEDLPTGAVIALPNDPSNEGRALLLLASKGIIELDNEKNLKATPIDIVKNPKKLKFRELESAFLPRALDDVTAAFINTNYALEAGLNPLQDALMIEGSESPYANIIAVRSGDEKNELILSLIEVLTGDKVKDFILNKYQGAVVPVF